MSWSDICRAVVLNTAIFNGKVSFIIFKPGKVAVSHSVLHPFRFKLTQYVIVYSTHTQFCTYLLSLWVQSHQKKPKPKEPLQTELSRPRGDFRNVLGVSSSAALVQSLLLKVALELRLFLSLSLSLRPLFAVSPVVAVRAAASQLQWSGGWAVPSHPWWGALHGRRPGALQVLRCGGKLREPEGLPVWRPHWLQWSHHKVSYHFSLQCDIGYVF